MPPWSPGLRATAIPGIRHPGLPVSGRPRFRAFATLASRPPAIRHPGLPASGRPLIKFNAGGRPMKFRPVASAPWRPCRLVALGSGRRGPRVPPPAGLTARRFGRKKTPARGAPAAMPVGAWAWCPRARNQARGWIGGREPVCSCVHSRNKDPRPGGRGDQGASAAAREAAARR